MLYKPQTYIAEWIFAALSQYSISLFKQRNWIVGNDYSRAAKACNFELLMRILRNLLAMN